MTHRRDPLIWVQIPVLPLKYRGIKMKIELKLNAGMILSMLVLVLGIIFYIAWGLQYHVWADIGIYSITAVMVSLGILGSMASIIKTDEKS